MRLLGVTGTLCDGLLTPEQQAALDKRQDLVAQLILEFWSKHGYGQPYPMVAMPTGFGKSRVVHLLLQRVAHQKILLIVGTKNILLEQNAGVFTTLAQFETGEAEVSILPDTSGRVVLATWQGLAAYIRKAHDPEFGLVIVDEVHNIGTRQRIALLQQLNPGAVVGLTATAYRSNGEFRAPEDYGFTIVDSMPLPECIDRRWLSPLMGICIDAGVTLPAEVKKGGTLKSRALYRALRKHPDLFRNIANELADNFLPSGMKTIVVVNRVEEEACVIARQLQERGFKVGLAVNNGAAKVLSGEFITLDAIERYKLPHEHPDAIQVLISPQVIGEGFDAPTTECVVWAAPTLSALRYTQVVGRVARRWNGKLYGLVVDFVYLIEQYGYSYNFAQFFPKEVLQELEGGAMYVGPQNLGSSVEIPSQFTANGRVISVADLHSPVYPPGGDWLTLEQISVTLGTSAQWVEVRLERNDVQSETRIAQNGHPRTHYPPSALHKLQQELEAYPPADDWLTIPEIADLLRRNNQWVSNQLKTLEDVTPEMRYHKRTRCAVWPHYHPSVVHILRGISDIPAARDWLTLKHIADVLRKHQKWVVARLEKLGFQPEERKHKNGKIYPYYPPSVLPLLQQELESVPPAGDWLTRQQLADRVERSLCWVKNRESAFQHLREKRVSVTGQPGWHYPSAVLDELRKFA